MPPPTGGMSRAAKSTVGLMQSRRRRPGGNIIVFHLPLSRLHRATDAKPHDGSRLTGQIMAPPTSVAVVGFGKMGILHSSILRAMPEVRLAAMVEPQPLIRTLAPSVLKDVPFYKDVGKMLDEEQPDAVFVTTPTGTHPDLCQQVLQASASVFVEKPLGDSAANCEALVRLAATSPATTMVGYSKRFTFTFEHAKRLLDEGVIGEPRHVHASGLVSQVFSKGEGWRYKKGPSGGGILAVIGCHVVDLLRWYFGDVTPGHGVARSIYSEEVEDEFQADFTLPGGAKGSLDCSWSRPGYRLPEMRIRIEGDRGSINVTEDVVLVESDKRPQKIYKQQLGRGVFLDVGGPEYTLEDLAFIGAVKQKRPSPVPIAEGYLTQLAVDRFYERAERVTEVPA